ncbi:MAG TPA: pyridoxamine 5'-phosphate oxidase family protein [Jiangellaceae bacterium]|nr:pyridoxamine 5'-phosphate oxidase family protein [Jiangellaceae bacterium]
MATRIQHRQTGTGVTGEGEIRAGSGGDGQQMAPSLTAEQVWRQVTKATFAVLCHVTPAGDPRSSGVLYKVVGGRLYVAVAPDSWKARHIPVSGQVAVTVPVRRGGLLSLVAPIPPATVSFHARAIVHPAGSAHAGSLAKKLGSLLPAERQQDSVWLIEVIPEGEFVTYGLGVSLPKMRIPEAARARVPVLRG